jgi:hypothetical protein
MKKFWHRLTPGMVGALEKASKYVYQHKNEFHLRKDLIGKNEFTKVEYNNFQKLRYHALVAKVKKRGAVKRGYWLITKRGFDFLAGRVSIPDRVQTFRNKITAHSTRLVFVKTIYGAMPYFDEAYDYSLATEADLEGVQLSLHTKGHWDYSTGNARWIEDTVK